MKRTLLLLALSVFTGLGLIRITRIIEASSYANALTPGRAAQTAGSLLINDVSATERDSGSAEVEFTVTLSADGFRDWDTLVDFATADGSGTVADGDYTSTSGTLTFPAGPGTVTMTVRVPVIGDARSEANETFAVNLSNARTLPAGFVNIDDGQGICTIINDDSAPPLPQVSINDVSLTEGNSGSVNASFTVSLSSPSSSSVMVSFATADDTATVADNDYTNTFGTLTFPAGDNTPKTIVVPIIGDSRTEPDERFILNLSNPVGATVADGQGLCTIVNDDQGGGGLPDVSIDSISVNEGDSGIVDAVFTVTLSAPSTSAVMVDYRTADHSATVGDNDYVATSGTLSFAPGTLTRTITVGVIGDTLADYDESFSVILSNPIGAVVSPRFGSCRIIDNEPKPTVSINNTSLPEGDVGTTDVKFRVTLSFATRLAVSLSYESRDGSATRFPDNDYERAEGFLRFPPGATSAEIIILINGDFRVEPNETFFVDITESSLAVSNAQGECTIFDDDAAKPGMSINDISMSEGTVGTREAVFTVTLAARSLVAVTVDYHTQDVTAAGAADAETFGADYVGTSGTLTFPAGITTKQIIVPVFGDPTPEPDETFVIDLYNARGANIVKGRGTCTLIDDDLVSRRFCSREPQQFHGGKAISTVPVSDYLIISTVSLRLHFTLSTGGFVSVMLTSPNGTTYRTPAASDGGSTCVPLPDGTPILNNGSFRGERSRGIWTLSVDAPLSAPADSLDCWCLEIMGAETGIGITPVGADPFAYATHQVKATVLAFGRPLSGADVNFDIVSQTNNAAHESALTRTDDEGQASLVYERTVATSDLISAQYVNQGRIVAQASAQAAWQLPQRCPVKMAEGDGSGSVDTVNMLHRFRDEDLSQTTRGRHYTDLYYRFSGEAARIMMLNPMLMLRAREMIELHKPLIQSMVDGEATSITSGDLEGLEVFLNSFAAKGGEEFKQAVSEVCADLRDPQVHSEFGITVVDGPRRSITPLSVRIVPTASFGLLLFLFGIRRDTRRKLIRVISIGVLLSGLLSSKAPPSLAAMVEHGVRKQEPTPRSNMRPRQTPTRATHESRHAQLSFEPVQGTTDSKPKFLARGRGYSVLLGANEAVLKLRRPESKSPVLNARRAALGFQSSGSKASHSANAQRELGDGDSTTLRMKLAGANQASPVTGIQMGRAVSNYFIGNESSQWRTGVPGYKRVKAENVYPGIDVVYYGNRGRLEYDFIVAPGADPAQIALAFEGAGHVSIEKSGDLVLRLGENEVRQQEPLVYQDIEGCRREIWSRYSMRDQESANRTVGFELGEYDRTRPLIIDPILSYSTYLGGSGDDEGNAIAVDSSGNLYVIGFTDSADFPTASAAQPRPGGGGQDVFISKLDQSGTQLIYSTYLGGTGQDNGSSIAIDGEGNAYITGFTGSTNFPVRQALQPAKAGPVNAFVAKLNPSGSLLYSTHLGGSVGDYGSSISVDSSGAVYVAGVATSPNFPTTNAIQSRNGGSADVYVAMLNPSGNRLMFSTFLGGTGDDGATSIAIDSDKNIYIAGVTSSSNFRTANPLQGTRGGGFFDAFVAKLNPTGTQLLYATYLGGAGEDRALRITADSAGNAYVTGDTDSANFPITPGAARTTRGGGVDAFVAKINARGSALIYSTFLGGAGIDGGTAIAVDSASAAYVTGFTSSSNFPTESPLQPAIGGGSFDAFVAKLSSSGGALEWSTYLGGSGIDAGFGIAVDPSGNAYVMGQTDSTDFPTASSLQSRNGGGSSDVFLAKIGSASATGPRITGASITNKRLLVHGTGFDDGAKILVDGQPQKTASGDQTPGTSLESRKAGKSIRPGQTVMLQVRNSDGSLSNEFRFTR